MSGTYNRPDSGNESTNQISSIGWSPDGQHIASDLIHVQVWRPDTGDLIYEYVSAGESEPIYELRWSPDSKRILTTSRDTVDFQNTATWDALTGDNQVTYPVTKVSSMDWSPDSSKIVAASDNGLDIWDAHSAKNLYNEAAQGLFSAVSWSPNGRLLAVGRTDNLLELRDSTTDHTFYTYKGHTDIITSIAWSPNSSLIASVDQSSSAQVWRAVSQA